VPANWQASVEKYPLAIGFYVGGGMRHIAPIADKNTYAQALRDAARPHVVSMYVL
jgi:hypothetical protein